MTDKPWPAQITWSELPTGQRRKVMVRLGCLIRRCLTDPHGKGSGEAADEPADDHGEDPAPSS